MTTSQGKECCEKCYGRQGTIAGGGIFCSISGCNCHKEPYNKRDHTHCFDQEKPPCGLPGKHRCCLCETEPSVEEWGEDLATHVRRCFSGEYGDTPEGDATTILMAFVSSLLQKEREVVIKGLRDALPDFIEKHYPKGISKERGAATTHIALFIAEVSHNLSLNKEDLLKGND